MARFLSEEMDQLTRQLLYAPPAQRRKHLDNAERLYWEIDPEANYPMEYLVWRLTQTHVELTGTDIVLVGEAVRKDLIELFERISDSMSEPTDVCDRPPLDLQAVRRKLGVSAKTIRRYRRKGLFARRMRWPDGRKRLAFMPKTVERFKKQHDQAKPKRRFSRIDESTRHRLITRARRIASRTDTSPFQVARHLARRTGRSTEAIRRLLIRHDRQDPRTAIFPEHSPPLTDKQQAVIDRAYRRGIPVTQLAEHFGRARNAIYRAINLRRARRLHKLKLRWVDNPTFEHPDATEVILGRDLPEAHDPASSKPDDTLDAETETALFIRYNFMKYLAHRWIGQLDRSQPKSSSLDEIETILRRAGAAKQHIATSFLRLVSSVAARQVAGSRNQHQLAGELRSEGNLVLLETIETFDVARENRFSTYLTWALRRRFFQAIQKDRAPVRFEPPAATEKQGGHIGPGPEDLVDAEQIQQTLSELLKSLDERERFILKHHFGLHDLRQTIDPMTLGQVAGKIGISAERARQIEHRALQRLRTEARRRGLEMPSDIVNLD